MFIDNCLQILRIMNLEIKRLQEIDMVLKDMEAPIRDVVKKSAIESSGLSVRSTININKANAQEKIITENDIVDLAIEEACKVSIWYFCWIISEEELSSLKKYCNPFSPLMEIFASGLWPLGISQKQYLVLFPGNNHDVSLCK